MRSDDLEEKRRIRRRDHLSKSKQKLFKFLAGTWSQVSVLSVYRGLEAMELSSRSESLHHSQSEMEGLKRKTNVGDASDEGFFLNLTEIK